MQFTLLDRGIPNPTTNNLLVFCLCALFAGFPTRAAAAAGPIRESRHRTASQRHGAPRRDNGQAIGGEVVLPFCCPMCRNGIKVGAGLQRFAGWS